MKIPYVSPYKDRHGKLRHKFRRNGYTASLPGAPGTAAFADAYAEAMRQAEGKKPARKTQPKGSLSELIDRYYCSAEYLQLAKTTRRSYESVLDKLNADHGDKPARLMDRAFVQRAMAKRVETPGAANKLRRMIRQLYNFGMAEGLVDHNPCDGVKPLKVDGDGFIEWSEENIKAFRKRWKAGTKQRLALMLALHTGQRRGDLAKMQWNHIRDGRISVTQAKGKARLRIRLHDELAAEMDRHKRKGLFILLTQYGRPFTVAGLGNWFGASCRKAGLPKGMNFHGLRKAQGRRLAENGCTAHQIMSVLGHKSLKEAERYTKGADQEHLADEAIERLQHKKVRQRTS